MNGAAPEVERHGVAAVIAQARVASKRPEVAFTRIETAAFGSSRRAPYS